MPRKEPQEMLQQLQTQDSTRRKTIGLYCNALVESRPPHHLSNYSLFYTFHCEAFRFCVWPIAVSAEF
jgi:hypothetical protein